ncbi:DNA ligase [Salmonella phage STP-4]
MPTLVETLFPGCTLGRGGSEANGLAIDVEPKNCTIIDKFHDNHYALNDRRDHYLVSVGESLVHLRICSALPGCGYDAFAYIHAVSNGEMGKESLIEKFKSWKDSFTSVTPPNNRKRRSK